MKYICSRILYTCLSETFRALAISFIVVPIYVRLLTTGEYGDWSVFQSWRDILIIFASLNLCAGVYTKTLVDNRDDRDRYTSSMQGLGTLISVALLIIYFLTHEWTNKLIGLNTPYMILLFAYFILDGIHLGNACFMFSSFVISKILEE